jgi:uncharacterized membrane protein
MRSATPARRTQTDGNAGEHRQQEWGEDMTWILRYRISNYVRSSIWLVPFTSLLIALPVLYILRHIDYAERWNVFEFGPDGARAILGILCSLNLTIIAFMFSALLITAQIASAQLSPRVIVPLLRDRPVTYSITLFVFSLIISAGTLGRMEDQVLQLSLTFSILLGITSISVFLFLVDYWLKALRPISVFSRVAADSRAEIEAVYPYLLNDEIDEARHHLKARLGEPDRVILHTSLRGVLQAADFRGLAALAQSTGGVVEIIPRIGEFTARGEPLLNLYGKAAVLDDHLLRRSVAFGDERTIQQDPMFGFRILVDIASKALSPAINDPTTAVLAIDQLHRLLRSVGRRRLDIDAILDRNGRNGVIFRTPDWPDFVTLAVSEIRQFGGGSLQVVRRLRAMLENVKESLPRDRWPPLTAQLQLLDAAVKRNFPDAKDRALAGAGDYQGIGSDDEGAAVVQEQPAGAETAK